MNTNCSFALCVFSPIEIIARLVCVQLRLTRLCLYVSTFYNLHECVLMNIRMIYRTLDQVKLNEKYITVYGVVFYETIGKKAKKNIKKESSSNMRMGKMGLTVIQTILWIDCIHTYRVESRETVSLECVWKSYSEPIWIAPIWLLEW